MELKKITKVVMGMTAVIALAACGTSSYPGLSYDWDDSGVPENNETMDETPILVYVNEPNLFSLVATRGASTRGTGSFENVKQEGVDKMEDIMNAKIKNSIFYIYAFRNEPSEDLDYTVNLSDDPNNNNCLVDDNGSNTYPGDRSGKPSLMPTPEYGVDRLEFTDIITRYWTKGDLTTMEDAEESPLYWSSYHQQYGYNFFGYFYDDVKDIDGADRPVMHRDKDSIYCDIRIDGTQDVMVGYAPHITDINDKRFVDGTVAEQDRKNIINFKGWSTYAAHRNINPTINFKHVLTQLRFQAFPGDENAGDITIYAVGAYGSDCGRFVVANNDTARLGYTPFEDRKDTLWLHDASVDGVTPCGELTPVNIPWDPAEKDMNWYDRKHATLGAYVVDGQQLEASSNGLLVAPADTMLIVLKYYQMLRTGKVNADGTPEKKPSYSQAFYKVAAPEKYKTYKPGMYYTIKIGIYGRKEIEVYADVTGWENGGEWWGDPDDDTNQWGPDSSGHGQTMEEGSESGWQKPGTSTPSTPTTPDDYNQGAGDGDTGGQGQGNGGNTGNNE